MEYFYKDVIKEDDSVAKLLGQRIIFIYSQRAGQSRMALIIIECKHDSQNAGIMECMYCYALSEIAIFAK